MADDLLPDYEYLGLMAEAWDVLRGDTSEWEDRALYLQRIRAWGEPVLDVGCGTGRLLLDYAAEGIDIDGVDNSPDMLALCRAEAAQRGLLVNPYQQFMETLALPRQYRTILVPSSTLQLLIEPAVVAEAVRRLWAHLLPGGGLVASMMTLWHPGDPLESHWEKTATRTDDVTFRRVARSWYDPTTECESTEDLYQKIVDGQVVAEELHQRTPATRSYTQAQALALLAQAGFEQTECCHVFTLAPAEPHDTLFTVVGRRPQA